MKCGQGDRLSPLKAVEIIHSTVRSNYFLIRHGDKSRYFKDIERQQAISEEQKLKLNENGKRRQGMTLVIFHFSWAFTLRYLIAHQLYCQYFLPPQIASLGRKLRCDGAICVDKYGEQRV